MAPLPPNSTARLFVDYITGNLSTSVEHTFQLRWTTAGGTVDDAQNLAYNIVNSVGAGTFRAGWRVLRVRVAAAGSDFSFPVPLTSLLASFVGTNSTGYPTYREAEEWTFQGRSLVTGRRVDISLYGITAPFPENFRFPVGGTSPAWVASTVNTLNNVSFTVGPLAVDGNKPVWYPYVNVNYNSYWERERRVS